ncbi:WxL domain-containing protein [bacterium]|nr:WxL domain-containing protein [bacterium]
MRNLMQLSRMALVGVWLSSAALAQVNFTSTLTAAAGTNSFSAPASLGFTGTITGNSQSLTGNWGGTFAISDKTGTNPGWDVAVRANANFAGTVPPGGLASPSINQLRLNGSGVSFAGSGLPPSVKNNIFPITTSNQVLFSASSAAGEGVGSFTFTNPQATLTLPANIAAGTWSCNLVFTAVNL